MQQFIEPYKIKTIVLTNVVKLNLPNIVKIHLIVNVSRIVIYKEQVERQKLEFLLLVKINSREEYKKYMREKLKYLVRYKKLKNLVEKFKKEYRKV